MIFWWSWSWRNYLIYTTNPRNHWRKNENAFFAKQFAFRELTESSKFTSSFLLTMFCRSGFRDLWIMTLCGKLLLSSMINFWQNRRVLKSDAVSVHIMRGSEIKNKPRSTLSSKLSLNDLINHKRTVYSVQQLQMMIWTKIT